MITAKIEPREISDPARPLAKYVVDYREGRKRRRRFFRDLKSAKAYCRQQNDKTAALGFDDAGLLTHERQREAVECLKLLDPLGATLTEAVEHFIQFKGAEKISRPADQAAADWLARVDKQLQAGELKPKTAAHYQRINKFAEHFKDRPLATITLPEITAWLESIDATTQTRIHYRAVTSTFYSWAVSIGIATENLIVTRTKRPKNRPTPLNPFKPAALRYAFDVITGHAEAKIDATDEQRDELRAFLAMGSFAGLRASEIMRADWSDINFKAGEIDVPLSKDDQSRTITLTDAARAWLKPIAKTAGPIISNPLHFEAARPLKALRKAVRAKGHEWPTNAPRATFATVHFLLNGKDAHKTILQTGHSTTAPLTKHYIRRMTEKQAKEIDAMRPRHADKNLIRFTA